MHASRLHLFVTALLRLTTGRATLDHAGDTPLSAPYVAETQLFATGHDRRFLADLRYACRGLLARPAWSFAALARLAIGTGANTASLSVINAVLLRPLPFPEPNRITAVALRESSPPALRPFSLDEYVAMAPHTSLFTEISARTFLPLGVAAGDPSRMVQSELVSANYFAMLRVAPLIGRFFADASDVPEVVVSERLWRERFNRDASILGQRIRINGREAVVTGVAPAGFIDATQLIRADLWLWLSWFTELNSSPNAQRQTAARAALRAPERGHRLDRRVGKHDTV